MSRRRCTTAKMFSGNKQGGAKRPSQSRPSAVTVEPGLLEEGSPITADTLARHLAAEALLRDASEERTTWTIKRYFRLTMALVGINVLVAGTAIAALWTRSSGPTHAVPVPTTPGLAQPRTAPQALFPATPSVPTLPALAAPVPVAPATPASLPAAIPAREISPLPTSPSTRREPARSTTRPRRPAVKIQVADHPIEDVKTVALDSIVERW